MTTAHRLVVVIAGAPADVLATLPGALAALHPDPSPTLPRFSPSPWDDDPLWSTEP